MSPAKQWGGDMMLEPVARRRRRRWPVGSPDWPDGVESPDTVAARIMGDLRRQASSTRWTARMVKDKIVTLNGTVVPQSEVRVRGLLLEGARRGDVDAARQLWLTRRAWVVPAQKGGVERRDPSTSHAWDRVQGPPGSGRTRPRGR